MNFTCSSCGACCRRVSKIDPKWPTRADGACYFLQADNKCAIYETRPQICRVDALRPPGLSVEKWHALNTAACNAMKAEDGIEFDPQLTPDALPDAR